jgi:hypothetical protein
MRKNEINFRTWMSTNSAIDKLHHHADIVTVPCHEMKNVTKKTADTKKIKLYLTLNIVVNYGGYGV